MVFLSFFNKEIENFVLGVNWTNFAIFWVKLCHPNLSILKKTEAVSE
jgi:hypothetical protein